MSDELAARKRELEKVKDHRRLIRARQSEYRTDNVPGQLVKKESMLIDEIMRLEAEIKRLERQAPPPAVPPTASSPAQPGSSQPTATEAAAGPARGGQARRRFPEMITLITITVAVLGCLAAWLVVPEFRQLFGLEAAESVIYAVTVESQADRQPIFNATVKLSVPGTAPLSEFTDSNGFASILVPGSYAGQPGELQVNADGFDPRIYAIDLPSQPVTRIVQLVPAEGTAP